MTAKKNTNSGPDEQITKNMKEIAELETSYEALRNAPRVGRNTVHVKACLAYLDAELCRLYDETTTLIEGI